ncbi:MAG TPA: methylmalonyl Co-A mutase-associated GTPase MeaB [Acidimicrobiaceae bacterium]|nr:methylmalonyl Co-A mutase-associated GTPase MeaB [Acidimicrobiaceae bacterium]HCB37420.1 methylmalonyl Co-A mutase-associated GTPase MeaB [Acidimicrobiaceae bacterium]
MAATEPEALLREARAGSRPALARLLSLAERAGASDWPGVRRLGAPAFAAGGTADGAAAHTVGITGAPGSGKSSVTSEMARVVRARDERLAVLAVDPSSPFSGGAILGDRIRMGAHAADEGVYIRSMASRGHLGGLALATPLAARVLAAAGWPWIVIETVGVGQVEVAVAGAADTTVVVVNPGWGDAVQANKAGLMEIADIFVVNKSDRPGAAETRADLGSMLGMSAPADWTPPIVLTVGITGEGVEELWDAVVAHRRHLTETGELARRRRTRADDELGEIVRQLVGARVAALDGTAAGRDIRRRLADGELDPYAAAEELLAEVLAEAPAGG